MKISNSKLIRLALCALILSIAGISEISAQDAFTNVPAGSPVDMMGIIATRDQETFTIRETSTGNLYLVEIAPNTDVKTYKKGAFRGGKEYATSYLLRGLRVTVKGSGNAAGHIVASDVNFNEDDLKTAQALKVTVDPIEQKANEEAAKLAAQIAENEAMAAKAQGTADEALAQANRANTRINGLDEYDTIKTIVVPFATNSYTIGPKGRGIIDEAAEWAKTQDRKGWMVAVVGFADSTGNTAKNKTLSEKRANAVIAYLVTKHGMQMTRLVQPFGAGVDQPAATNATADGRAANRRVEIKLLRNKGIAGD